MTKTESEFYQDRATIRSKLSEIERQIAGVRLQADQARRWLGSSSEPIKRQGELATKELERQGYKKLVADAAGLEAEIAKIDAALAANRQRQQDAERAEIERRRAIAARYELSRLETEAQLAAARLKKAKLLCAAEQDAITPDHAGWPIHFGMPLAAVEAEISACERQLAAP